MSPVRDKKLGIGTHAWKWTLELSRCVAARYQCVANYLTNSNSVQDGPHAASHLRRLCSSVFCMGGGGDLGSRHKKDT